MQIGVTIKCSICLWCVVTCINSIPYRERGGYHPPIVTPTLTQSIVTLVDGCSKADEEYK